MLYLKVKILINYYLIERNKALFLDYTIAILKPNIVSNSKKVKLLINIYFSFQCRVIVDKIEKANFEIFDVKLKTLTEEEVANLFYKHTQKGYYQNILDYMTSGPVAILILTNLEDSYVDESGITVLYLSPILRFKELIGNKDPTLAKSQNANCLRALYGSDIVFNEFYSSDSLQDAYRELNCFMMELPVKVMKINIIIIDS